MAKEVTIDIQARFTDNVTQGAKAASKTIDKIGQEAEEAGKKLDNLAKKKTKPKLDADNSSILKKLKDSDSRLMKFGRTKAKATLDALDKASDKISKVLSKGKAFAGKTWSAILKFKDSDALNTVRKLTSAAEGFTKKTWTAAVKIKDMATAPLRGIKNTLFSIKSLVLAITAGLAAKQFVVNPVNLADAYSSAQIGFSTLLGESQGQQMMDDLDAFAKATPFKSSQVIAQTQRMLAMGWNAEDIITDMETIGDAAAATGKGEQGLQQIVTALSQIKTKGRLSTEELNQLAEAGISAKRYLAEGLGYGSGDEGIAKMTKDLENGAISSGKALEALLTGMKEYQGMMDKTANETVSGLWSQIEDTFEINVARRWGQGLQDGFRKSFGNIVELIDEADGALNEFGDTIYDVGSNISNWIAERLENAVGRITEITGSYEFQEADLGGKVSMLWNGVVVDPLKEWWEGGGQEKSAETAGKIGAWMGETITSGLLAIFGVTDVFADSNLGENGGMSVAQSFVKGFKENFDGSAITEAFVDAVSDVWGALPAWAKVLVGGYVGGKAISGIGNVIGGITSVAGGVSSLAGGAANLWGSTGTAMVAGTGIASKLASVGYSLTGGAAGSTLAGGTAALIGGGAVAGGIAAAAANIKGAMDLYGAYKAYKSGDTAEAKARTASGGTAIGGVAAGAAAGAAIGSVIPGLGTAVGALVGAGVGGIAGWIGGEKWADNIRAAKYEVEGTAEAIKNAKTEEEKLAALDKAAWESMKNRMGDIKLSASEITRLADQIVWGEDLGNYEKFTTATKQAEASLQSLKTAAESTDKWLWKASLGVKFNDDEKEAIKTSFDEYIASAKSYVENKHYEFTAAVSLLVDVESEGGKSIIDSGDSFFSKMQEDLDKAGKELGDALSKALEDGIISADEQKAIAAAQKKIAEITEKINNAEAQAEIELIKVKFGDGNLDLDSFDSFMQQMKTTLEERIAANDEAFKIAVSGLQLQLAEGAITKEEYNKQLQTLIDGYEGKVDSIKAEVLGVELEMVGEAFPELGEDVVSDLQNVLNHCIEHGIDPIELKTGDLFDLVGTELSDDAALALQKMLSGVYEQIELVEVDGELLLKLGVKTEEGTGEKVEEAVENSVPDNVETVCGVKITGEKEIQNSIDVLVEDFDIPREQAATIALLLTGDREILNKIDVETLAKEFGIPKEKAERILMKLTGDKSIQNRINVLMEEFGLSRTEAETILWQLTGEKDIANSLTVKGSEFGLPDSITKTIKVNISAAKGKISSAFDKIFGARGGVFGGSDNLVNFARGGVAGLDVPGFSEGGVVRGGAQLVTVAEEGTPEMIIPLSNQRRDRALQLWAQTGHMLDVPGFARGGLTGGGEDEGLRFFRYGSDEPSGGQNVEVNVGGVQVTIHVDANGQPNIAEAIREQGGEIAETVAGILADAFGAQFENTPTKGGAA